MADLIKDIINKLLSDDNTRWLHNAENGGYKFDLSVGIEVKVFLEYHDPNVYKIEFHDWGQLHSKGGTLKFQTNRYAEALFNKAQGIHQKDVDSFLEKLLKAL